MPELNPAYREAISAFRVDVELLDIALNGSDLRDIDEAIAEVAGSLQALIAVFISLAQREGRISSEADDNQVWPWTEPMRALQAEVDAMRIGYTLERVERLERATEKASGSVGGIALASDFGAAAGRELKAADILRAVSFALLGTSLAIAIWVVADLKNLTWQAEVARLAIAIPLLGGAYFASSEARDHRSHGRLERGWQSRIDSLDAFCASLPDDMRHEVRRDFARALFVQPPSLERAGTLVDANADVVKQLNDIVRGSQQRNGLVDVARTGHDIRGSELPDARPPEARRLKRFPRRFGELVEVVRDCLASHRRCRVVLPGPNLGPEAVNDFGDSRRA